MASHHNNPHVALLDTKNIPISVFASFKNSSQKLR